MELKSTEEIREALKGVVLYSSLHISGIPDKTKLRFQEIANDKFAGDYGMTLLWLVDFSDGILSSPNEALAERIDLLVNEINGIEYRVTALEVKPIEKKTIRTVGGKVITIER